MPDIILQPPLGVLLTQHIQWHLEYDTHKHADHHLEVIPGLKWLSQVFGHVSIEVSLECVGGDEYFAVTKIPECVYEGGNEDALGRGVGQADQEVEDYAPPAYVDRAYHAVDPAAEESDLEDAETDWVAVFE